MRKLLKGFLVVAGILLASAAVVVMAINLYVQSAGTQKRIETALSSGLKAPVHLTSTIVTPWSGLKASGITVPQTPPAQGNFLEASGFTARFDWTALLKHRLDASEVSLDQPVIEWFQSPGGRWEMPRAEAPTPTPTPRETPTASPAASPPVIATPKPTAAPSIAPQASPIPQPTTTPGPARKPWEINVHKLMVNGASFDFWDEKGIRLLEFAGVEFNCINPRVAGTEGTASCKFITLHDRVFFNDMRTNWSFKEGVAKLSSFQTTVGGGQILGDAAVWTQARHSPFNADVSFSKVNVDQLMRESGEEGGEVTGQLEGWLDINGNSGKRSSLNGSGELELTGGRMQNIEILQMLGRGLQIPDLVELNLKTAEVDARVVSGMVYVDKLQLQSQNLQVTGTGRMQVDGSKLAMNARLTVNGVIIERLPSFILTYFHQGDTAESRYIDFDITNTLGHPKTDLLENILGHRVQSEMTDLIKSIFGKKRKALEPEGTPP